MLQFYFAFGCFKLRISLAMLSCPINESPPSIKNDLPVMKDDFVIDYKLHLHKP
jgi:hypothetical protein